MVRNCAPENLGIPCLVLTDHPGMTEHVQLHSQLQQRLTRGRQIGAQLECLKSAIAPCLSLISAPIPAWSPVCIDGFTGLDESRKSLGSTTMAGVRDNKALHR